MGRRSRKRSVGPAAAPPPAPGPRAPRRTPEPPTHKSRREDAPRAPWSPFPLVELTILLGLVLIVLGFVGVGRPTTMLAGGFALVTLAGLELSIREHFAGYRSHTSLLAGACAVALGAVLYFFTPLPQWALLAAGVVTYAAAFAALRDAFRRRTGGIGFRA